MSRNSLFLLLLLIVCVVCTVVGADGNDDGWCVFGTVLRGGEECLCTREGEDSCVGALCGRGYGTSFYPKKCSTCRCVDPRKTGATAAKERKITIEENEKRTTRRDREYRSQNSVREPPPGRTSAAMPEKDTKEDLHAYMAWRDKLENSPDFGREDNFTTILCASLAMASILMTGMVCLLRSKGVSADKINDKGAVKGNAPATADKLKNVPEKREASKKAPSPKKDD